MLDLLLKNAHVYAPDDLGITDIGIRDEKIVCVQKTNEDALRVIDCAGKTVFPGAVETHCHMLLPVGKNFTVNDFYKGSAAGALGGVTSMIDFADQVHGATVHDALQERLKQAENCAVDYSFSCTLTDINERTIAEVPELIREGFPSFKFYTAYSASGLYVPEDQLRQCFEALAAAGGIATVHAETEKDVLAAIDELKAQGKTAMKYFPQSRPVSTEESAIRMVIRLAREAGCKLVIRHVTSRIGAELIEEAQRAGAEVIGETCPQYLMLTEEVFSREDARSFVCQPPIRTETDQQGLWSALERDVKFTIGTDDCCFLLSQKNASEKFFEVPGGLPGIEVYIPILLTYGVGQGRISPERFARLTSTDPAKLYGLYPRKGVLLPGADADLYVAERCEEYAVSVKNLHEGSDYTPYEGLPLRDRVCLTVSRGRIIAENGEFLGKPGDGRLLTRTLPLGIRDL